MPKVKIEIYLDTEDAEQKQLLAALLGVNSEAAPAPEPEAKPETKTSKKTSSGKKKSSSKKKEPEIAIEDVRKAVSEKVNDHRATIKKKLTELGAKNVTSLAEASYGEFLEFVNELE